MEFYQVRLSSKCTNCGHYCYEHGDICDDNNGACRWFPMGDIFNVCKCNAFKLNNVLYLEQLATEVDKHD